jgi:hypothetical protein
MKKLTLILIASFSSLYSYSQSAAKVENDTAKYDGKTFAVSDTITLGYGSKSDKDFAFIRIGSALEVNDLGKVFSKNDAVIDKIYKSGKRIFMRAKLTNKTVNLIGGNKLFIDLEGAIDNKELIFR